MATHISQQASFTLQNGILKGRATSQDTFLPVIPSRLILSEIVKSHWSCHHRGLKYGYQEFQSKFFHKKGITSAQDAKELSRLITTACTLCLHRSINYAPKLFHQARRCALSLALPHCSILSHDVLQIASAQSLVPPSGVRYISLICCNSCNYLGAKIIIKNDSHEIASHLLVSSQKVDAYLHYFYQTQAVPNN